MCVCTLRLAIRLDIRLFSTGIIERYPSYCIIAWVLTCVRTPVIIQFGVSYLQARVGTDYVNRLHPFFAEYIQLDVVVKNRF